MIDSNIKSYPNYKPSGVEWLGDVPTHWEVRRLKVNVALMLHDKTYSAMLPGGHRHNQTHSAKSLRFS